MASSNDGQEPEKIDFPPAPLHPPSGGEVPIFLDPSSTDPNTLAAVFVDGEGERSFDEFTDGYGAISPDEIVRHNFRRLRKKADWSLQGMAVRLTQVSHGKHVWNRERVKRIESGRKKAFSTADLYTFCHAFEVAVWDLLLPPDGRVIEYSNNLVDRDKASELLFHTPVSKIDEGDIAEGTRTDRATEHTQRWKRQIDEITEHIKDQFIDDLHKTHDEFLKEMQALGDQKGTESGPHPQTSEER